MRLFSTLLSVCVLDNSTWCTLDMYTLLDGKRGRKKTMDPGKKNLKNNECRVSFSLTLCIINRWFDLVYAMIFLFDIVIPCYPDIKWIEGDSPLLLYSNFLNKMTTWDYLVFFPFQSRDIRGDMGNIKDSLFISFWLFSTGRRNVFALCQTRTASHVALNRT